MFFWIALFVWSLALQYVSAVAPTPVKAASGLLADTVQGFEIDGDLLSGQREHEPRRSVPASADQQPADGQWRRLAPGPGEQQRGRRCPARTRRPPSCSRTRPTPVTTAPTAAATRKTTPATGLHQQRRPEPQDRLQAHHGPRQGLGNSAFAYLGAERIDNNGTMVVDFELNQKPFKQSTRPAAAQAQPHARRPADLARILERRQQPDRDHLHDRQRPELRQRPDERLRQGHRRRRPSTPSAARPTSSTSTVPASATPCPPSTSPRRPSTCPRSASPPAAPASERPHPQPHRRQSAELAAQGRGAATSRST